VITAPNSDLNVTDGQTDRQTLWHHRTVKIGIQIIADIIGITDILSQKYRYIVNYKNRHGPSLLTTPMHAHRHPCNVREMFYKKDEQRALSNTDTKYDALTHI